MILILTDPGVGGTFLTWSLHYLAGHKNYFHAKTNSWTSVLDDPTNDINAHLFLPNQPTKIDQVQDMLTTLKNNDTSDFHTMYFHNLIDDSRSANSRSAPGASHQPSAELISSIIPEFKKIIVLSGGHPLYQCSSKFRFLIRKWNDYNKRNLSNEEQLLDYVEYFFADSYKIWQEQNLNNIWDLREFLALNMRPFSIKRISVNIDLTVPHYCFNTFELYTMFDQTVDQLFDFLEIEIDSTRKSHWDDVYNKWKKIHVNRLSFAMYFNTIIDYIVNGNNMDLVRFDLDLVQEAAIQHYLIYKHNLNLKTWQLEKFTNTNQLHNLLEPSPYTLEHTYLI
jgi:hypothetical protein